MLCQSDLILLHKWGLDDSQSHTTVTNPKLMLYILSFLAQMALSVKGVSSVENEVFDTVWCHLVANLCIVVSFCFFSFKVSIMMESKLKTCLHLHNKMVLVIHDNWKLAFLRRQHHGLGICYRRSEKWRQQGIHYKSASTVDWTYGTKGKKPLFAQNFIFKVYSGVWLRIIKTPFM